MKTIGEFVMEELCLIRPTHQYAKQIKQFKTAMLEAGNTLDGTAFLKNFDHVDEWIDFVLMQDKKENNPAGMVPVTQYLCIRTSDDVLVGMIDIRHELNDYLASYGGHIGYSIHPNERNKGYAKRQLQLALKKVTELGLEKVLITCADTNIASKKVIEASGGVYEDTRFDPTDNTHTLRYWITISK